MERSFKICLNRMQNYSDMTSCANQRDSCNYLPMFEDQHKSLAEEFGFDTGEYIRDQVDCASSGGTPGEADL